MFDQFWQEYPRKVGKAAAFQSWQKVIKRQGMVPDLVIHAIRDQVSKKHFTNGSGEQFIPNPATWLNQGRWDDEITEKESPHAKGRPTYVPKQ